MRGSSAATNHLATLCRNGFQNWIAFYDHASVGAA